MGETRDETLGEGRPGVGRAELAAFWRRFSILVRCGVRVLDVLDLAGGESLRPGLAEAASHVRERLCAGGDMSGALADRPEVFPPIVVALVRGGERAGALDAAGLAVAELYESGLISGRDESRGPREPREPNQEDHAGFWRRLFHLAEFGLPIADSIELAAAECRSQTMAEELARASGVLSVDHSGRRSEGGLASALEGSAVDFPPAVVRLVDVYELHGITRNVFGAIAELHERGVVSVGPQERTLLPPEWQELGRFWRLFATLLRNGIPIIEVLELAERESASPVLVDALAEARACVSGGGDLADALDRCPDVFPPIVTAPVRAAEQAGRLDDICESLADMLERGLVTGGAVVSSPPPRERTRGQEEAGPVAGERAGQRSDERSREQRVQELVGEERMNRVREVFAGDALPAPSAPGGPTGGDEARAASAASTEESFEELLRELEEREEPSLDVDVDGADEPLANDAPVTTLVNEIITEALERQASDIHLVPTDGDMKVLYRIDGVLCAERSAPAALSRAAITRIKIMAMMDIAERRVPQSGTFRLRHGGRDVELRASTVPSLRGETCVLRVLAPSLPRRLGELGLPDDVIGRLREAAGTRRGLIAVAGPSGSGKSTTARALLMEALSEERAAYSIEDPVPHELPGVVHVQVGARVGMDFASALRSVMLQDADVVLVGEIRDHETAELAFKAAANGHMVVTALATSDAPSTVTRFIDMGIEPFLVSDSLVLVAAQRLVRGLCGACRREIPLTRETLLGVGFTEEEAGRARVFGPVGCGECSGGYRGRIALVEAMPMSGRLREMTRRGASTDELRHAAVEEGMLTLRRYGLAEAAAGRTSLTEVLSATPAE